MFFRKYSNEEESARYHKTLWRVFYDDGRCTILLKKSQALDLLHLFNNAEYIEKMYGWFKGKRIYK